MVEEDKAAVYNECLEWTTAQCHVKQCKVPENNEKPRIGESPRSRERTQ